MKLVIDTVKKWKFENFEQNMCYLPQKKVKKISKIFPMSQWSEIFFYKKKISRGPRKYGKEQSHGI